LGEKALQLTVNADHDLLGLFPFCDEKAMLRKFVKHISPNIFSFNLKKCEDVWLQRFQMCDNFVMVCGFESEMLNVP
jgi:hypothetical protein